VLAYVFWHWPREGTSPDRYAENLVAFHRALAASPPPGFRGSRVLELDGAPWCPVSGALRPLEDWYFVDDFTALGALNEAAVSGARRAPHDGAARLAAGGAGGVYRRLGDGPLLDSGPARWFGKPADAPYPAFLAALPQSGAEVWQRQLVLGPAPEFCVLGGEAPGGATGLIEVPVRIAHSSF
jgi:hypothetical protein